MNPYKRTRLLPLFISLSLLLSLSLGILVGERASASGTTPATADKVAPDLRGKVRRAQSGGGDEVVKVILQFNGPISATLNALLNSNGVHIRRQFQNFNIHVVELPASVAGTLASFAEVSYVSLDAEVKSSGHVSLTTGADAVRTTNG